MLLSAILTVAVAAVSVAIFGDSGVLLSLAFTSIGAGIASTAASIASAVGSGAAAVGSAAGTAAGAIGGAASTAGSALSASAGTISAVSGAASAAQSAGMGIAKAAGAFDAAPIGEVPMPSKQNPMENDMSVEQKNIFGGGLPGGGGWL